MVADVLALLLYTWMLPRLTRQFQEESAWNVLLIAAFYGLFCVSVYTLRISAARNSPDTKTSHPASVFWSLLFSLMILYAMVDVSGLITFIVDTPLNELNETLEGIRGTILTLGVVAAGFLVASLAPVSMIVKPRPLWRAEGVADVSLQAAALLGINLMIIVTMAHWELALKSETPYEGLGLGAKIIIFGLVYCFFLLFYGMPRAVFFGANPSKLAVVAFFAQTGYYIWRLLADSAWT